MSVSGEDWYVSVVSGKRPGPGAAVARALFGAAEPIYSCAMLTRNLLFSRRILKAAHAARPVISVGNLTTGGTGKTPIVAWLAGQLRAEGRKPAVLLRGYKAHQGISDEQVLLSQALGPDIPVLAGADRYASSIALLTENPAIDVFVLDDGFQHRKLARHFDLVLIDATAPFGFDHVIPRGLLREPIRALRRASAVVITRCSLVDALALTEIERRIRAQQPEAQIFLADFGQDRLLDASDRAIDMNHLRGKRIFGFCGIGNPSAFLQQLRQSSGALVGSHIFPDHHGYSSEDLSIVQRDAQSANAEVLVTTEKDWIKLKNRSDEFVRSILRVGLSVRFTSGAEKLVGQVIAAVQKGDQRLKSTNSDALDEAKG